MLSPGWVSSNQIQRDQREDLKEQFGEEAGGRQWWIEPRRKSEENHEDHDSLATGSSRTLVGEEPAREAHR